jgi:hypothetical protein
MIEIDFVKGYRFATIEKGDKAYIFLDKMVTTLLMKKLSAEDGQDVHLAERELLALGGFSSNAIAVRRELEILIQLNLIIRTGYQRKGNSTFMDSIFGDKLECLYNITEHGQNILREVKYCEHVELRF